jgi:DNA-binding MarR family transcriptional regulator
MSRRAAQTLAFMQALWALDHDLHRASKRMAAAFGVTGPQRLAIRIIGRDRAATASTLAQALHLHPSTLTGVLGRLEAAGLIRRAVDAADRRRTRLVLTARGRRIYRQRGATVEAAVARALARGSAADAAAAIRAINAITDALRRT